MNYEKEILTILQEAGDEGLSLSKIAKHVFNSQNSFFDTPNLENIHYCVSQYLIRNSKNPDSLIERCAKRGVYRLNQSSPDTLQLMLCFCDDEGETLSSNNSTEDKSLSLF